MTINNDKTDNRLENLQIISQRENASKICQGVQVILSAFIGTHQIKKWTAKILINKKRYYLGLFKLKMKQIYFIKKH